MADPVLCPVMPELVEVLQQPGGWVTTEPVRVWLAADNVLCVEETDKRAFRDLANAVADYLEGRIGRAALGQELVVAANALGTASWEKSDVSTLEERQVAAADLETTLTDWFPDLDALTLNQVATLAIAAYDRAVAQCHIIPAESASDLLRYDGDDDAR